VKQVSIVKEQEQPDGKFPTCPYPNPEKKEALQLGLELCRKLARKARLPIFCWRRIPTATGWESRSDIGTNN
jgi:hypothetical protein